MLLKLPLALLRSMCWPTHSLCEGLRRVSCQSIDLSLASLCAALDVLVLLMIIAFSRQSKRAALCLVPYLGWILFATALNAAIKDLNPR